MRRVYLAPILVTAGVVLFGGVGAAGFATGLKARAAKSEMFTAGLSDATPSRVHTKASPRILDPEQEAADWSRVFEAPQSAALRYGIVELLPSGFLQSASRQSASLRATLEAATDAALEPPWWRRSRKADEVRR